MKHKNILMVSDDFYPAMTGAGIHVQIMSKELVQRGHNIFILTSKRKGQSDVEYLNGVKVFRIRSVKVGGFYQTLPTFAEIRQIIEEDKIEIIHQHYISLMMKMVSIVAKKYNLPQVYTYHMSVKHLTQPFFMKPFAPLLSWLLVKQCNSFNQIISPSLGLVQEIKNTGVDTPIKYNSNPVIMNHIEFMPSKEKTRSFQAMFAGRLAPEKNIPLLINAIKILADKNIDVHLWIAGEGGLFSYLEKMVKDKKLEKHISFLGQLTHEELGMCYNSCDVFVLPSTLETQGLVVMEAMRFSKPVIVTHDIVSALELVDHEENGFIISSDSPEELSERLLQLNNSEELRKEMGKKGYIKSKSFGIHEIVNSLLEVYDKL